jgi:hypothetical protein
MILQDRENANALDVDSVRHPGKGDPARCTSIASPDTPHVPHWTRSAKQWDGSRNVDEKKKGKLREEAIVQRLEASKCKMEERDLTGEREEGGSKQGKDDEDQWTMTSAVLCKMYVRYFVLVVCQHGMGQIAPRAKLPGEWDKD